MKKPEILAAAPQKPKNRGRRRRPAVASHTTAPIIRLKNPPIRKSPRQTPNISSSQARNSAGTKNRSLRTEWRRPRGLRKP